MSKPPLRIRRVDVTNPIARAAIEKLRTNSAIAMLQALGGEFEYDDAAHERARGYAIEMHMHEHGMRCRLKIVPKP